MRAAVVAVGTELLSTDRLDTNSLRIAELLERYGVDLVAKSVCGDDEEAIAREIERRLDEAELVLVSGGLGPTADDVTREAAAAALGRPLVEDPTVWSAIVERFASFGRTPSENNRRQCQVIEGARVLDNPRGTAPGILCELPGERALVLLPGVPVELEGLLARHVEPWLATRAGGAAVEYATLKTAMRPESDVDRLLEPAYREFGRAPITVLAAPGEVRVRLTVRGVESERRALLAAMRSRVRGLLGDAVFTEEAGTSLEAVVGALLAARGLTLATAESCTGGLLAERLTRIPGSSAYFLGGVVAYSNASKRRDLAVDEELLARHGAVSEPVARALAEGARRRFGAELGVGITGVAGPGGGSEEKPVGTVHVALAGPGEAIEHRRLRFPGDRERVRWFAAQGALEMVRRRLLGTERPEGVA